MAGRLNVRSGISGECNVWNQSETSVMQTCQPLIEFFRCFSAQRTISQISFKGLSIANWFWRSWGHGKSHYKITCKNFRTVYLWNNGKLTLCNSLLYNIDLYVTISHATTKTRSPAAARLCRPYRLYSVAKKAIF